MYKQYAYVAFMRACLFFEDEAESSGLGCNTKNVYLNICLQKNESTPLSEDCSCVFLPGLPIMSPHYLSTVLMSPHYLSTVSSVSQNEYTLPQYCFNESTLLQYCFNESTLPQYCFNESTLP